MRKYEGLREHIQKGRRFIEIKMHTHNVGAGTLRSVEVPGFWEMDFIR